MGLTRRQFIVTGGAVAATTLVASPAFATPAAKEPRGQWLVGDTHVHDDHSSDGSLPRQQSKQTLPGNLPVGDQIGQAERTGLDFLPLTDHRTYDQHWDPQWTSDKLLLIPGEEANGSPHAIVLGAVDAIVDGANPPGSAAFRHVQQSIWDARSQDAVWHVAHPDDGEYTPDAGPNDNASVQGVHNIEVLNVSTNPDAQLDYAENRWNHGFRTGVTAASDCHFRELWGIAGPGQPATRVFAADRSVRSVLDALKAGRTTVSSGVTGPFVTIEADLDGDGRFEAIGGDETVVHSRHLPRHAALRVRVRQGAGARLLVYAAPGRSAGAVLDTTVRGTDDTRVLPLTLSGDHEWFRAEVRSPGSASGADADPNLPDQLRAATSPVFVSVGRVATPEPEIPLPAAGSGRDNATSVIGAAGDFAGFADVAVAGDDVHVVAEKHVAGRSTVVYRHLDRHGRGLFEVELSGGSGTATAPRIAASGRDVWVVWQDERGHEQPHRPAIYLRHSALGGLLFGPAVRLDAGTGRAIHPAIALLGSGRPVVAWADNTGGAFDVYTQVVGVDRTPVNVSAAGKTVSAGNSTVDARSPRYPASLFPTLAVGRDDRILVAWQDNRFDPDPLWTGHTPPAGQPASGGTDPDNWQILAATRAGTRGSWSGAVQVSAATDRADRHPSASVDRTGAFVLAWDSGALQSSGANLSLRAGHSADGGRTWSPAEPFAAEPAAMSQRPRLSRDPDGTVRAVWYDSRAADWRWKVFTARLTPAGWSAPAQVTKPANATFPAASGGVVVFTSDRGATRGQRDGTQQVHLLDTGGR
ncbi:CehA/McbA family metallohydrolase [Amycolatopsis sp. FDAARGOS 1241]|uniref:CehA/McbA family metallohydrolase n=1 Tax=Amycolatopsis sp. FDAARGOS 1241 TaxID=2778070 RepID=UPI001951B516|nr:CehA/McbA family metallohydrolase [Amycolatopsis sp. FDAARGOS 1241]QRP50098.1 PHP domain-containing protein [Amycolatopsis sp. FDAARGOS 1241]